MEEERGGGREGEGEGERGGEGGEGEGKREGERERGGCIYFSSVICNFTLNLSLFLVRLRLIATLL